MNQEQRDSMALDNDFAKFIILNIDNQNVEDVRASECCIYEVPEVLRKENEDAFTPYLISIGPIHRKNAKLHPMEQQKIKYFEYFRRRLPNEEQHKLEIYTAEIGMIEQNIRRFYSYTFPELDKKKFVHMILLDAVFIMELFLRNLEYELDKASDDYLLTNSWIKKNIERDLLLIENQIPFRLLQKLYELVLVNKYPRLSSFLELSCIYFKTYDPYPEEHIDSGLRKRNLLARWENPQHFTDLMRFFFASQKLSRDGESIPFIKTATKLEEAGITFEPVSEACLLDVEFQNTTGMCGLDSLLPFSYSKCCGARLKIPRLIVDGSTESIFRNLMVFELLHYPNHTYVCNYVALFDYLIDTEKDVDLLIDSKVIVHTLGRNKDLAVLFNKICKNIVVSSSCYCHLSRELNKHDTRGNKTWAALRLVYFRDLWRGTSTVVGIAVLAFSVVGFIKALRDLL